MSILASARRSHLERSGYGATMLVAASLLIGFATLVAVAWVADLDRVESLLRAVHPVWFAAALGAEALAYGGYVLGYREVSRAGGGRDIGHRTAFAAVLAGFGPFIARGGFVVDLQAFRATGISAREARVRVLGLGALEYAVLAPAACGAAIALLITGVATPSLGFTLPWAVAVPAGFLAAAWAVGHRQRFHNRGGWRESLAQGLDSIYVLRCLLVRRRHLLGPLGVAVYWFGEIVCLWACLHAFTHGSPSILLLLIGYATGYALTRRTLPLGGAGAVEALLPFALSWTGIPLAAAVLAVFSYRVINLWLPAIPAALGLRALKAGTR